MHIVILVCVSICLASARLFIPASTMIRCFYSIISNKCKLLRSIDLLARGRADRLVFTGLSFYG